MEEPKLIDIFALLALHAVIKAYPGEDCESAALTAYDFAEEMMKARKKYISKGKSDEQTN
jgi:hypothetical protein